MSDYIARREDGRWECPHCGGQIDTFADSETVASIVTAAVEAERARIVSAVEAVIGQWPINPPDMPLGRGTEYRNAVTQCANAVRAALASAAPALEHQHNWQDDRDGLCSWRECLTCGRREYELPADLDDLL